MSTVIEDASSRAAARYAKAVVVEADDRAFHVTLGGEHFVNDWAKAREAIEHLQRLLSEHRHRAAQESKTR